MFLVSQIGLISQISKYWLQRYNKICRCARKIAFSCVFLLGGISPSTKQVADIRESRLARRESVEQRRNYEMGLMDKERTEYSTISRGNRRIFTRRTITSAPHNASMIGDSVERRIGSRVRGKYWMIMEWYRSGNEVVTRKKAER